MPLSSILMLMQNLLKKIVIESQRRSLLTIIESTNMLIFEVSGILNRKLIELGTLQPHMRQFDPERKFR